MVNIEHAPQRYYENCYIISGENIEELLQYCLPRIRQKSQGFYRQHIEESLQAKGECLIDLHAGMGSLYTVVLREKGH